MPKILLDDIKKVIVNKYDAGHDFISAGQIIRKDSGLEIILPYPPFHHIDEEDL